MPRKPDNATREPDRLKRRENRENSNERGYTYRWQKYRLAFLASNPLCVRCEADGQTESAHHVDHVIPVESADDPGFWDPDNHQSLCASCHAIKTNTEDRGKGRSNASG